MTDYKPGDRKLLRVTIHRPPDDEGWTAVWVRQPNSRRTIVQVIAADILPAPAASKPDGEHCSCGKRWDDPTHGNPEDTAEGALTAADSGEAGGG